MAWMTGPGDPATYCVAIVPNDSASGNLAAASRALYVGVTGDVVALLADASSVVTFKAMPVGFHPIRVLRVNSTSTTATNMLAIY